MTVMTLRDIPDDLHAWLRSRATVHGRTPDKEAIALLEEIKGRSGPQALTPDQRREAIERISRHSATLPKLDHRSPDDILGYDENGLPA
ncbi:FitA-like ribbon-helix-helix domain-containing protein [Methylomagnum sp.]